MLRRHQNPIPFSFLTPASRHFSTLDPAKFNRLRRCIPNTYNGTYLRGRTQTSYDFEKRIRLVAADSRQCVAWPIKNFHLASDPENLDQQQQQLAFDPKTTVAADVVRKEELHLGRIFKPHPMALYYVGVAESVDDNDNGGENNSPQQKSSTTAATSKELEIETIEGFEDQVATFGALKRRKLQTDGDTNLLQVPVKIRRQDSNEGNSEPFEVVIANIIQVIEPDVRDISFQKMEAQVELITAFRNVLMDFFELACPPSVTASTFTHGEPSKFDMYAKPKFTTLRVPPLSLAFHGGKFDFDIEKMHRAALIQAFHRCSGQVRDWFAIHHESVVVELFVPRAMIESFHRAFYESGEAWETPESALIPKKFNMYPGLQMPTTLLESAPGFIGKREEIKALALPYEERIKRLEEIDEENFQKKLLEYENDQDMMLQLENTTTTTDENGVEVAMATRRKYLGTSGEKPDGKIESEKEILSESEDIKIRMVGVKSASRMEGGGVGNIFK